MPDPGAVFVDYRSSSRRWRVALVAVGAVVLLLLAGYAVRTVVSSPAGAVRAYFQALADRDVEAALGVVAPEIADPVERDAINAAVLRSEHYQPPTEASVDDLVVTGRNAVAEVSYVLDGRSHQASLRLRRADGPVDRLFPRWLVVDAIGTLQLVQVPDEVTVNAQSVPAYDAHGPRLVPALPGGYQVGVGAEDPLWQERAVAATVHPQRATEVRVPTVLRAEVREQVEQRVTAMLDDCADSSELVPPGCPFGYAVLAAAEEVQWRIERYPAIAVDAGREHGETVLVVRSTRDGEAVVSGVRGLGGPFEAQVPFPVAGLAVLRGGGVIFNPGW